MAEGCWLVGRGLGCGEVIDVLGGLWRMVTSSGMASSASSHSTRVAVTARCLCVFGGGGAEAEAGFRTPEGGGEDEESSHSS